MGPMTRVLATFKDPLLEFFYLNARWPFPESGRGHDPGGFSIFQAVNQQTPGRVSRLDGLRPITKVPGGACELIEPETGFTGLRVGSMTSQAIICQDRPDFSGKIDFVFIAGWVARNQTDPQEQQQTIHCFSS